MFKRSNSKPRVLKIYECDLELMKMIPESVEELSIIRYFQPGHAFDQD
jgi:hypothetical protein